MAAPLSPSTTYVASSTPSPKAQDFNDLQKYLYSGIYSGFYSILALKIDGVGGNAVSPVAAQLVIGQSALADLPLAVSNDQVGHARSIIDHLGYRTSGRNCEFREDWAIFIAAQLVAAGTAVLPNQEWWQFTASGANSGISTQIPSATYQGSSFNIVPGTANTNTGMLSTTNWKASTFATYISSVLEFEFIPLSSLVNITWQVGLFSSALTTTGFFLTSTAGGVWTAYVGTAGSNTTVPTAVSPALNTPQRFRIEVHGSASPYAANTARFFINDVLVATIAVTFPAASAFPIGFLGTCTGAATGNASVGEVWATYNRWASSPAV